MIKEEWKTESGKYACPHCNKEYTKKGIYTHIWRMHGDGKKHNPNDGYESGKRIAWNKGLTKETDENILKQSESQKRGYKEGTIKPSGFCGKAYHDSDLHKINSAKGGGYREKAGSSKKFYVNDSSGKRVCLQSSYELKCSEILNEMNIHWIRPKCLPYVIDSKAKRYFPDFYLSEYDIYLDPKNDFLIKKDTEKIRLVCEQNKVQVFILSNSELNSGYLAGLVQWQNE